MKRIFLLITIFFVCLLLVGSVNATDYYVTPSGAGSHTGQIGNEWTIYQAAANAVAGDTVHLAIGEYILNSSLNFNNDGTASNPIIWEGIISQKDLSVDYTSSDGTQSTLFRGTYANNGGIKINGDYNIFKKIVFQQDTPAKVFVYISGN